MLEQYKNRFQNQFNNQYININAEIVASGTAAAICAGFQNSFTQGIRGFPSTAAAWGIAGAIGQYIFSMNFHWPEINWSMPIIMKQMSDQEYLSHLQAKVSSLDERIRDLDQTINEIGRDIEHSNIEK